MGMIIFLFGIVTGSAQSAVVKVKKSAEGWQLLVDEKPFVVKGICYTPYRIGESPHDNTARDWMTVDDDGDGRNDFAYQTWVDSNRNNKQDSGEKEVGDFQLLKETGVNVIRVYHHASDNPDLKKINPDSLLLNHAPNKELMRAMHKKYGIWVMMGDLIGAYAVGSGAQWETGTDYRNPVHRDNIIASVEAMVQEFKDEPYILFWALGNENNYPQFTQTNAKENPEVYAKFVNQLARRIHELDPYHPVVLVNGETELIDVYALYAPDIDIFGVNSYRLRGFGTMWKEIHDTYDKPVLLTEFGIGKPPVVKGIMNESRQAILHRDAWLDIEDHLIGGKKFPNNSIGGFAFQWQDNWWQSGDPWSQNMAENKWHFEFNGITAQGDGTQSPFLRQLRGVYFTYQALWK